MTLDDIYGSDQERFPLEQEADWYEEDIGLVWDQTEVDRLAVEYGRRRSELN